MDDPTLLKDRQQRLKALLNNPKTLKTIRANLKEIAATERTLLWFWQTPSESTAQLYDMIYYNIPALTQINESTLFMQLSNLYKIFAAPAITTLSPIVTLILPYIMLRLFGADVSISSIYETLTAQVSAIASRFSFGSNNGKVSPFVKYLSIAMWVVFYLQGAYSSVMSAYNTNKIINNLHNKANNVAKFIRSHTTITQELTKLAVKTDTLLSQCTLNPLFDHQTFKTSPTLLTNKGLILTSYYKLLRTKDQLIPAMMCIGEIDAYVSIATLIEEKQYNFAEFTAPNSPHPTLQLKEMFHPALNYKRATKNALNINEKTPNILITGPNKAGKSTYIKTTAIALILAQTLTICNAKQMTFTPFTYIDSYLNIPDCEGKESLYEAELNRCYQHFQKIKEFEETPNRYMFTIMDEIFSSTNNREGEAAAYAILKKLTTYQNVVSLITTHYYTLSGLEKDTDNKIANYKFTYYTDPYSTTPKFDYKIHKGSSNQYIALNLLKEKGFDDDIIESAYRKFNSRKTKKRTKRVSTKDK